MPLWCSWQEIHYNNPDEDVGQLDSSGVRFYYTTEPRRYEMGVLQLADPFVGLFDQSVGDNTSPYAQYTFECPSMCSRLALGLTESVTVVREHLHMHEIGVAMTNEVVRGGEVVHVGRSEFFDFSQSGGPAAQQEPYQVLPGDSFRTKCTYRADQNRVFGLSR